MTIEVAILACLDRVRGYAMPEGALHTDVNMLQPQSVTLSELKESLHELEVKNQVTSALDDLQSTSQQKKYKWRITDNGSARVASLR